MRSDRSTFLQQVYKSFDAAIVLYIGAPLAALTGAWIANTRALRLYNSPVDSALTIYDVELKARYTLHAALWGHPFERRGYLKNRLVDHSDIEGGPAVATNGHGDDIHDDTEQMTELAHQLLKPQDLADAEAFYRKGCAAFRKSPLLQVFVARFHHVFTRNKHLHMRCVLK